MNAERHERSFLELEWSLENEELSVRPKECDVLTVKGLSGCVTIDHRVVSLREAKESFRKEEQDTAGNRSLTVEYRFSEPDISWVWEISGKKDRIELIARLKNNGLQDIMVSDWNILQKQDDKGGIVDLGNSPESIRFFAWQPWAMRVERFSDQQSCHCSTNLCHLFDPSSQVTFLSGFVTVDRMQGSHGIQYNSEAGVTEYKAVCSFGQYKLKAGNELHSETLRISYHNNPNAALESWSDEVNRIYNPSFEGTLDVLWVGWAWNDAFTGQERWGTTLLENTDAIREKLKGFDVRYVEGGTHNFLKDGLPGNWLGFDDSQAPDGGFRALFQKMKDMGFALKLWFSPFWFFGETQGSLDENRDNLLKDKDGLPITASFPWEFDHHRDADNTPHLTAYYLDGTHPETKKNISRIFKAYRELGARAYMLDFLSVQEEARLYDESLLPLQAARNILKVIREAAGPDTHIQTAVASTPGFVGLINAARVGRDYGEGRPMYPFHGWRNATYVQHDEHFGNADAFVQNAALSWFTHRKVFVNDFNGLAIDKPVPLETARISTTMFGLAGGTPIALLDDLRYIDPERLRMLKLCLPRVETGMPEPVDLFDHVYPDDYCRILKLPIETPWDTYTIVAVFNMDRESYDTSLEFAKLGLDENKAYRVFEFWNQEYVGTFKASCKCTIPPSACRVYRLSEARKHPWLISTGLHMQQGAIDIESLEWNERSLTLSGVATRPAGENGNLFFLMPRNMRLINHERACLMKEVLDMQTVIRVPIEFRNDKETFELRFEAIDSKYVAYKGWLPYSTEDEWLSFVARNRAPEDTRVIE